MGKKMIKRAKTLPGPPLTSCLPIKPPCQATAIRQAGYCYCSPFVPGLSSHLLHWTDKEQKSMWPREHSTTVHQLWTAANFSPLWMFCLLPSPVPVTSIYLLTPRKHRQMDNREREKEGNGEGRTVKHKAWKGGQRAKRVTTIIN